MNAQSIHVKAQVTWGLEADARASLPQATYDYIAGGAGEESTADANVDAFRRIRFAPRYFGEGRDTVDLQSRIFGVDLSMPVFGAPVGFQGLVHPGAEVETRAGVEAAGTVMAVPLASSKPFAEVVEGSATGHFLQLYPLRDMDLFDRFVASAESLGYRGIILTIDTPVLGDRRRDVVNKFVLPADVRWSNFPDSDHDIFQQMSSWFNGTAAWSLVERLRSRTSLPIVVKGIITATDALRAIESGAEGLIVSNHGGRQLDGLPASIVALPAVVEAVRGRVDVAMDGGVRSGADVVRALALGANAVLIGRPMIWALHLGGRQGVAQLFESLKNEIIQTMILLGVTRPSDLSHEILWDVVTDVR